MNQAYLIQAHAGEKQLIKLINVLLDSDTDIFIHIDKKNDNLYYSLMNVNKKQSNIYFIKDRESVNWSGLSQVKATLKLMQAANSTNKQYDYISLISGQDYPIKSKKYIKKFLEANIGTEFIECNDIGKYFWRLKCYNFFRENPNNRKPFIKILDNIIRLPQKLIFRRKNLQNTKLYYGSQWFTITYKCMQYILNYLKNNPEYLDNFKYTACADEHFFQIIIMNSNFKYKVANNNLRYIKWVSKSNSPEILTCNELNEIVNSDKLIARKFDFETDQKIIDYIDKYIIFEG
ncbi:beta-1,6-N-acetylglucosaminyltransferase [Heyndrickxia coagulans]|uniref:beta-1,6-N-acetylglucosaminyltransferase n=1 Tax=Heyndrickxia coagulans TaxID=1398 RepID=UPI001A94FD7E|nr:beta-1,6-N-acetylglucosaminyltransferase [Heyndrickxia coagulans]